jgi:hypothetical protein
VPGRDRDILEAAHDLLAATGEFDGVYLTGLPEEKGRPSGHRNACALAVLDWDDTSFAEDQSQTAITRKVRWAVTLMARREDPDARDRELDRLAQVAMNTLDGVSLAGLTFPAQTKLKKGRYEKPAPPERRLTVTGEFAYLVTGYGGHATDG